MSRKTISRLSSATPAASLVITALLAASLSGCAAWNYDRVQLGQQVREYGRVFPDDRSRRTETTLCYQEQDFTGRTDAIVVLLTRDRRVWGKLHAVFTRRDYGVASESGYVLRGQLDARLGQSESLGPIDLLRAVADELTGGDNDNFTREAQGWVAAGLVRLLQSWPHPGDEGPAPPRLTQILERVGGGGTARIAIGEGGVYEIEYSKGTTR